MRDPFRMGGHFRCHAGTLLCRPPGAVFGSRSSCHRDDPGPEAEAAAASDEADEAEGVSYLKANREWAEQPI